MALDSPHHSGYVLRNNPLNQHVQPGFDRTVRPGTKREATLRRCNERGSVFGLSSKHNICNRDRRPLRVFCGYDHLAAWSNSGTHCPTAPNG